MENATEAIIMAGAILLFIFALTISISSLTGLKSQMEDFLESKYQIQSVTDEDGNYLGYLKSNKVDKSRKVGVETIISSIRRMAKENYVIYIKSNNMDPSSSLDKMRISVEKNTYSNINNNDEVLYITQTGNVLDKYVAKKDVISRIYNMLKNYTFYEYIGIYKEEKANEGMLEAERDTYKILTFVQT